MKRKILLLLFVLFVGKLHAREIEVEIRNFAFSPAIITANVGDTIKWVNKDDMQHDVVANNGLFASPALSNGSKFILKVTSAGTFDYFCSFHPAMKGKIIVSDQTTSAEALTEPSDFRLYQNYPNPFNPVTKIPFYLAKSGNVKIKLYSVIGNELALIASNFYNAGYHEITFNGMNLSSGVYFYKLSTDNGKNVLAARRMILAK